jgi:uncharacterized membrane protein (UPF0182 family)
MGQDIDAVLASLVTPESKPPPIVSIAPPAAGARPQEAPASGSNAEALNHYRRALDAVSKGDWRTFGSEMDAMQKALQPAAKPSP